jgi:hypothetical protein
MYARRIPLTLSWRVRTGSAIEYLDWLQNSPPLSRTSERQRALIRDPKPKGGFLLKVSSHRTLLKDHAVWAETTYYCEEGASDDVSAFARNDGAWHPTES